jgi:hypothetical protein
MHGDNIIAGYYYLGETIYVGWLMHATWTTNENEKIGNECTNKRRKDNDVVRTKYRYHVFVTLAYIPMLQSKYIGDGRHGSTTQTGECSCLQITLANTLPTSSRWE